MYLLPIYVIIYGAVDIYIICSPNIYWNLKMDSGSRLYLYTKCSIDNLNFYSICIDTW